MARETNKGNRSENGIRVAGYSTKLYQDTIDNIKDLAAAGKVLYDKNYGERQVIEDALEAYKAVKPEHFAAAEKLREAAEAIKEGK
jgi:predicted short-subunit dehydrogenase-like oxidoreductase (DUF2520 family)